MNKNIKDKVLTTNSDEQKNHQAFAMELSRLKKAKESCLYNKDCNEYNQLGGDARLIEIEPMVEVPKKSDERRRELQKDTNPNNTTQQEIKPTEKGIGVAKVTKSADHSGGEVNKILSNKQALSEEINSIKYLIEYMNNNNKKLNL